MKYLLLHLVIIFLATSCSYEKTTFDFDSFLDPTWDFSKDTNLNYDENYVEVKDGGVQLKPLDLQQEGEDFIEGNFVGAFFKDNKILLAEPNSNSLSVTAIRPELSTSLIGYWRLDGDYSDISSSGFVGTPTGDNHFVPGRIGEAVNFDGDGDRFIVPDSDIIDGRDQLSIVAWVKPLSSSTGYDAILSKRVNTNDNQAFTIWYLNNKISVDIIGVDDRFESVGEVLPGVWNHIAVVYDGSLPIAQRAKIYINGSLDTMASESSAFIPNYTSDLTFTRDQVSGGQSFHGELDEVSFFSEAVTEEQVFQLWNVQKQIFSDQTNLSPNWTPRWSDIVGYWKMDGNWQDYSGKGHHAVANGTVGHTTNGKIGSGSGVFDDLLSWAEVPYHADFDFGSNFSFNFWVKPSPYDSDGSSEFIWGGYGASPFPGMGISLWDNGVPSQSGKIAVFIQSVGSWSLSNNKLEENVWSMVSISFKDGVLKIFINGEMDISHSLLVSTVSTFGGVRRIGMITAVTSSAYSFDGELDDLAIWNVDLTAGDFLKIYNRQKQKYAGYYDSEVMFLGSTTSEWPNLSWSTSLPFGKELVGDFDRDGNLDNENNIGYSGITSDLNLQLARYFNFNENSWSGLAGEVKDSSSLGLGGTVVGTVNSSYLTPLFSKSASFDLSTGYIDLGTDPSLSMGSDDYTMSVWIKALDPQNSWGIISLSGSTTSVTEGHWLSINGASGFIQLWISDGSSQIVNSLTVAEDYRDNSWHHLSWTFDRDVGVKIYVDGEEKASQALVNNDSIIGSLNHVIGQTGLGTQRFLGSIDEYAIWSRALSALEIRQLYRRGANRIKIQVKSCIDSSCECKTFSTSPEGNANDCDGDTIANALDFDDPHKAKFIGPGGDDSTYYSELFNRKTTDLNFNCGNNTSDSDGNICVGDEIILAASPRPTNPVINFDGLPLAARLNANPYFRYRVYMEADDNNACSGSPCLPELTSVNLNTSGQDRYPSSLQEVTPFKAYAYKSIQSIKVNADDCVTYQLSPDGTNYFYFNNGAWSPVLAASDLTTKLNLENHIISFSNDHGPGLLYIKAFLQTNANQTLKCSLRNIDVSSTN